MASVARYELVDDETIVHAAHHPRLDRSMRLIDVAYFLAEHNDHYLAEIVYLWRQGTAKAQYHRPVSQDSGLLRHDCDSSSEMN
jgi:hypothetical protein